MQQCRARRKILPHDERADGTYAHAKLRAFQHYGVPGKEFAGLHKRLVAAIRAKRSQPIPDEGNTKTRHWHAVWDAGTLYVVLYSGTFYGLVTLAAPGDEVYVRGAQLDGQS